MRIRDWRSEVCSADLGDEQETRVLVAAVIQGIEAARNEGIVDGADRQEARPKQRSRESQGCEHQEEIILRDAEFDMLSNAIAGPFLSGRDFRAREDILELAATKQPSLITERTEIGRYSHAREKCNNRSEERRGGYRWYSQS